MNKTFQTMLEAPIRNETGKLIVRQCAPKISYRRYVSLNNRNQPTLNDQLMAIQHRLRLIRITRGLS